MSDLLLSDLHGRVVYDVRGRRLGRLEELRAEIEPHADGAVYVVTEYYVGAYGALEALAGGHFARHLLNLIAPVFRYKRYRIPWAVMDLSDPERPRVSVSSEELPTIRPSD
jgi:hypothetical protein